MHAIGVGDLHDLEAEQCLHAPDAPDACHKPEEFKIIECGYHGLLATTRQVGEPFEAGKDAPTFLGQIDQHLKHSFGAVRVMMPRCFRLYQVRHNPRRLVPRSRTRTEYRPRSSGRARPSTLARCHGTTRVELELRLKGIRSRPNVGTRLCESRNRLKRSLDQAGALALSLSPCAVLGDVAPQPKRKSQDRVEKSQALGQRHREYVGLVGQMDSQFGQPISPPAAEKNGREATAGRPKTHFVWMMLALACGHCVQRRCL